MCRVKVLFRHNVDAEFFGKQVALATHRGPRVKHVQKTPQQFTVGHQIVELVDRGEGTSEMEGQTLTDGTSSQMTDTLTTAVQNADHNTQAQGKSSGTSQTDARQHTSTRTANTTIKQTLVPKIITRDIVSSLQFYSKDEIEWATASAFKQLQTGEAIIMVDGTGVWRCPTPEAKQPLLHAPKFAAKKLAEWRAELLGRPEFASPQQIQQERERFLAALTQELQSLSNFSSAGTLELHGSADIREPQKLNIDPVVDDDPEIAF